MVLENMIFLDTYFKQKNCHVVNFFELNLVWLKITKLKIFTLKTLIKISFKSFCKITDLFQP